MSAPVTQRPPETSSTLGYLPGIGTIFKLEILQRVRSRGWFIMLAIWFLVIAGVVALAAVAVGSEEFGAGQVMFELVIAFVLFFGMLIAPALSSNSITGDRANGTLAILQNTLLTPGQLLIGKWLAAWVASLGFLVVTIPLIGWAMTYGDVYLPGVPVLLGMLALELAIVCAIGVGVSAVANRTLFAVLISYLLVAMLGLGTLIAYGLSMELVKTEVMVSEQIWPDEYMNGDGTLEWDQNNYTCGTALYQQTTYATERNTWLLAANPFVVVADAVPRPAPDPSSQSFDTMGPMGGISEGVRMSQAGQLNSTPCINGVKSPEPAPANATPLWPLGLGLQLLLAGGLLAAGRRKLHTPAGKLASGTRIA
ncbi:ABC transporter permease [Paeniglutamicibacter sp. NPDC091659]|uniref:ABC transporter permease n=1 Tax=Paeniglutamicibacter sp. NPDC091659 TaxID=3364389 RepID=UPI003830402E